MLRNPRGGVEDIAEMAAAGFEWLGLNVADHAPEEWSTVRDRAAAAGVVVLPKARLGVPGRGATPDLCLGNLRRLVSIAVSWGTPYLIVNAEKELDFGLITGEQIAEELGDWQAAVSTEAFLYADVDWAPLTQYPVLLQIYQADNGWPVAEIPLRQADCVRRARAYGFLHVGVTFQSYADAQPEWYDRSGTAWNVFTGDDIGAGNWGRWGRSGPESLR